MLPFLGDILYKIFSSIIKLINASLPVMMLTNTLCKNMSVCGMCQPVFILDISDFYLLCEISMNRELGYSKKVYNE